MPYSLLPPEVLYPNIDTDLWVVISRLSETPVRVVPNLGLVNHASEFALPLPTGIIPQKLVSVNIDVQKYDDLGRPLYDDGLGGETTDEVDGNGDPLEPFLISITEERIINLRDDPEEFTLTEVIELVQDDFLSNFSFYDSCMVILFDDRYDSTAIYQEQQVNSGFASASHPIFVGPIFTSFASEPDDDTAPRGHLMLVAPQIEGVEWYFQIRHGVDEGSGYTGPIVDIEQASRLEEIYRLYPLENFPVYKSNITDAGNVEVSYFWLRTGETGSTVINPPYPIIPFLIFLSRSSGSVSA